jgi:glycosyltransferase involved in cell wall biosynthesis
MENMTKYSVIVPCFNEEATISGLLDALLGQTYPISAGEIIFADGMSTDQTRACIQRVQQNHPEATIKIVDNPKRNIPAGLNSAIAQAQGEIIIRLDAHCIPRPDYIERCLKDLDEGLGQNVGGVWEIQPSNSSWIARGIAAAASHPLGAGDAAYRTARQGGSVDTVPFGAYQKELAQRIGLYDESLLTNEDYEFNVRIRQNGGIVWLDPQIRSIYFARGSLNALAQQYLRYGLWKGRMLRRYPQTLRWRQVIPPLFVLSLLLLAAAGFFFEPAWLLLVLEAGLYLIVLFLFGFLKAFQTGDAWLIIGMPLAIATMHICWGAAFLSSVWKRV